ncbi:MAG: cytochrome c3 family protein [Planctomycetia bacterium]|nr:cytochrome c3 family protein [Planctomycetia bacterium]
MNPWIKRLKPFGLFLTIGIGACGVANIFAPAPEPARLFSHKVHVKDQQLECNSCHTKAAKEDEAGMPASLKRCMMCHETEDENKPPERKLAALLGEKPEWSHFTAQDDDIKFSHKRHVTDASLACAECHPGMEDNASVGDGMRMEMDTCMSCHEKKGASNDCLTCHKEMSQDKPPASHRLNWKQGHGHVARGQHFTKAQQDCALCHTESSCTACHQEEAPASHTNFFRLRGHVTAAQTDRSQCAVCHEEDSCNRCHEETAPRSHTAGWGAPRLQHCLGCHESSTTENCSFCHKDGAPSHRDAEDKPDWHNPGMNCRQCHGVTQILPHPDNGGNCNACHQ